MKLEKFGLSFACILSCNLLASSTTWTGASSNSWADASNWSGGVPTGTGVSLTYPSNTSLSSYTSTYNPTPTLSFTIASIDVTVPNFMGMNGYHIGGTAASYIPMSSTSSTITVHGAADILDSVRFSYLQLNGPSNLILKNKAQVFYEDISGNDQSSGTNNSLTVTSDSAMDTLVLTGPNTYEGGTTIIGGTLNCGSENVFPQNFSSVVFSQGALLDTKGFNQTINNLSMDSTTTFRSTDANGSPVSSTLSMNPGANNTISGKITGPISLMVNENSSLNLNGTANDFTGNIMVLSNGGLFVNSLNAIENTSGIILNNNNNSFAAKLTINVPSYNLSKNITLSSTGSGSSIYFPVSTRISGNIGESLGSNFLYLASQSGVKTMTLAGVNTYTGGTFLNDETNLTIATAFSLPSSGSVLFFGSSGTLSLAFGPGSQQIGSLGSFSETTRLELGTVILTTGSLDSSSFPGVINGSAGCGLIKVGDTTFTLSGANTYQGPTHLNAGIIEVGNSLALSSGPSAILTMKQGTTLQAASGFTGTIGNAIQLSSATNQSFNVNSNGQALTLSGNITELGGGSNLLLIEDLSNSSGSVVLSGTNSYTGGTTVGSGTLSVATSANLNGTGPGTITLAGGGFAATGSMILTSPFAVTANSTITTAASKTLQLQGQLVGTPGRALTLSGPGTNSLTSVSVATGQPFTISGVIGGTQTLTKSGSGTLALPSANSYSDNTILSAGSIDLSTSSSKLGSGNLTIGDASVLTMSADGVQLANPITLQGSQTINVATGTTTLSGNFSGGTKLTKSGSGILKLMGSNSTGLMEITSGGLAVIGGSLTSNINSASGSTLSGTGTITGNVVNSGNMAPGASIGTLTIVGDYTQADNSVFTNEINATTSDKLIVHGNVVIGNNATFALVLENGPTYTLGSSYNVITTAGFGTVSGLPFAKITTNNPSFNGLLTYPGDAVVLTVIGSSLFPVSIPNGNSGNVQVVLDTLFTDGDTALSPIFSSLIQLTPSELYSALDSMQPAMYKGLTLAQENNAVIVRSALSQRFQTILDDRNCVTCLSPSKNSAIFTWATGFGDFLHQSQTYSSSSPQVGYQANTGGFALGLDYKLFDVLHIGALGGYTHSNMNWTGNRGRGDINSGYAGLYASAIGNLFYGNFSLTGAWSGFNSSRNIIYPTVNQTAKNNHQGNQLISHLDTGLNFEVQDITIRPFDSLDWIVQKENGYTETGAGQYDLSIDSSVANMLRNELGLNFASCAYFKSTKLSADAKLGWVTEVRMKGKNSTCAFVGTNVPFTVDGYFPNRNLFSVGGTITATLLERSVTCTASKNDQVDHKYDERQDVLTLSLYYNGVFGKKYADNSCGAQFNYGF